MILKVARLGHPILRQVARDLTPEEIVSPDMQRLVDDMIDTMRDYDGVGLAAPQVYQGLRVLVLEVKGNPRYPAAPAIPLSVFFNLHIEGVGTEKVSDWEGCLSVPGLRGLVPRFSKIRGTAVGRDGKAISFEADGFFARILQHEGDHLDGKVYLDAMTDMKTLTFIEEFARFGGAKAGTE